MELKEGVKVKWADDLTKSYVIEKICVDDCGRKHFCRIEAIDKSYVGIVPIS